MEANSGIRVVFVNAARMISTVCLGILFVWSAFAGQRKAPSNGINHYKLVAFPLIEKTIGYKALPLGGRNFIEMAAVWVTLPKGFAHKLSAPANCIQLEYGYKRSGIVRLYEVPAVKGISAKSMLDAIFKSNCFKDVSERPGFATAVIPDSSRFVLLTSENRAAFLVAKSELTRH